MLIEGITLVDGIYVPEVGIYTAIDSFWGDIFLGKFVKGGNEDFGGKVFNRVELYRIDSLWLVSSFYIRYRTSFQHFTIRPITELEKAMYL